MKPPPVVGMQVMWKGRPEDRGTVTEVTAPNFSVRWDTVGGHRDHVIGGYGLHGQDWSHRDGAWPLSPAPAEPAKAAGWKLHDRCLIPATMVSPPEKDSDYALVELEGGSGSVWRVRVATLLPGSAPPAAAPAPHVAASVHGVDTRGVISQLADARSERDKFEASACKKELELGDKEREIARLRSALRDATAKLQRRGPL